MLISRYSTNQQHILEHRGQNPSTIITKMIQLAGRFCEYYASDIVFEAVNFRYAVEHNKPYHKYIFFREGGVDAYAPNEVEYARGMVYIQVWDLCYKPDVDNGIQIFQRLHVSAR